jgi:2-oxoglutarate ferredoxin oxidoreductase subunit beta
MAPTTLIGEKATTCIYGRDAEKNGNPIKMCEMLSTLTGPSYIARVGLFDAAHVRSAKQAIKKAFTHQVEGKGFGFVEVLSSCPTNWGMAPDKALEFVKNDMQAFYPLGVFKEVKD